MRGLEGQFGPPRDWIVPALILGACVLVGVGIGLFPIVGAGLGLAIALSAFGLAIRGSTARAFTVGLVVILLGYAFVGRGFAYLGVPPLFVGEVVLGLGILAIIFSRDRLGAFRTPATWFLLAFVAWSALATFPYLGTYGLDTLRDAVLWGYCAFTIVLIPILIRGKVLEDVPRLYARMVPAFILWAPVALLIGRTMRDSLPYVPGTEVPILDVKAGDVAVHLGGIAAFLILGLHHLVGRSERRFPLGEILLWVVWLLGFAFASAITRGGMLAGIAAVMVAFSLRPVASARRFALLSTLTFTIVALMAITDVEIAIDKRRPISVRQYAQNFVSIVDSNSGHSRDGTTAWRLLWWGSIIDYTFNGPYRWTGKGYGINLANADGFQVLGNNTLRSPHNAHMSVLARSGVPGFVLWGMFQAAFVLTLLRAHARGRARGNQAVVLLSGWVLAYWAAYTVNASFDVALEGPVAGIWYWVLIGVGLATAIASYSLPAPSTDSLPPRASQHRYAAAVRPTPRLGHAALGVGRARYPQR